MSTLTETLSLPGSNTPEGVTVTVVLAGENGQALPAGYATVGGETIVGRHVLAPDAVTGVWSVDLERNDQITPTGTAWKVVLSGAGVSASPRYVELTAAGTHDIADVLVEAPASVASSALSNHLTDTVGAHAASAISVADSGGNYAATEVEAVLAELPSKFQPLDSDLTAIAALTTTAYGRGLLAEASQSALATDLAADAAFTGAFAQASSLAPVVTVSTSDFVLANTGATWTDLDVASGSPGTAAARPMDIVIPNVEAGQWVEITPSGLWSNGAGTPSLRAVTVVAGAAVNVLGGSADNMASWAGLASVFGTISGTVHHQVQAGDIEAGAVRVRLQYLKNSASAKTLYGAAFNYRVRVVGRGPF